LPPLKLDDTPGPGQYAVASPRPPAVTLHGPRDRSPPVASSDSPGPTYQTVAGGSTVPPIHIGRRLPDRPPEATPGPGAYESARPRPRAASFGIRPAHRDSDTSPGPGSYGSLASFVAATPRISFHIRSPEPRRDPGAPYQDVTRGLGGLGYSMRSRYDRQQEVTPGCEYVPPPFATGVPKSTIAPRCHNEAVAEGPGQGAYAVARQIGSDAPSASFHGAGDRGPAVDAERSPGPAQYAPDPRTTAKRGPQFTMKGARYEPKREPTGEYIDLGSTFGKPRT
jgi:hypothetical protein